MGKKKGGGGGGDSGGKQKAARQGIPKGSSSGAQKRKEDRQRAHEHRVDKKERKLRKRIEELCKKLHLPEDHLAHLPLGRRHDLLRKQARKHGLVGEPLPVKKPNPEKEAAKEVAEAVNKELDKAKEAAGL